MITPSSLFPSVANIASPTFNLIGDTSGVFSGFKQSSESFRAFLEDQTRSEAATEQQRLDAMRQRRESAIASMFGDVSKPTLFKYGASAPKSFAAQRQNVSSGTPSGQSSDTGGDFIGEGDVYSPEKGIKLSNYGYASDSTPDSYSAAGIGHANNKLESGVSAAITKSLANRLGLKTGDWVEVQTADGKTLRRRYDDTVPSYDKRTGALPETVDLYEKGGSNSFGGRVTSIRKVTKKKKDAAAPLPLPAQSESGQADDYPLLPDNLYE